MTEVRIYRPGKTAMQSGYANTRKWVLEFEPGSAKSIDPLMGWTGSGDMEGQVKLNFASREEAVSYAEKHDYHYRITEPKKRRVEPKTYAENFGFHKHPSL